MARSRDNDSGPAPAEKSERLASLDALRGSVLLLFISGGFGVREMLRDERWTWMTRHASASEWAGGTLWDFLAPALLVVAGVAMPYSYANRQSKGQNWPRQLLHALLRSGILIGLGIYLDSYYARPNPHLVFDLRGDLQQLGLATLIAFLVVPLGAPVQAVTVAFLLIAHTAAYVIYAFAAGHDLWSLAQPNLGLALDQWLRLEPHPERYATLNVVPAAALVVSGTLVGNLARSGLTPGVKIAIMTACSLTLLLLGWGLSGGGLGVEFAPVIPMIRRLMTWTFVLTSLGWVLLFFTYFYLLTDGLLLASWAIPLSLAGRNALGLYLTARLFRGWAEVSVRLFLPSAPPALASVQPLLAALLVVALYWLFAFWLYRRRIFFVV